jgi:hypothetical protein
LVFLAKGVKASIYGKLKEFQVPDSIRILSEESMSGNDQLNSRLFKIITQRMMALPPKRGT